MEVMKKQKTMKEFLASMPDYAKKETMTPVDVESLTAAQRQMMARQMGNMDNTVNKAYILKKHSDGKGFSFTFNSYNLTAVGDKTFVRKVNCGYIFCQDGRLKVKEVSYNMIVTFLTMIGITWWKDSPDKEEIIAQCYKPSMLRAVMTGKVYSSESFYREWAKTSYHIKNVDWRAFRDFMKSYRNISIPDLVAFTTDINASLRNCHKHNSVILRDILKDCAVLNRKVNLNWSEKRMREEHLQMDREVIQMQIAGVKAEPLYDTVVEDKDIEMLNTEQRVFAEGMLMHHCIWTCYFNKMKANRYIGFHMSQPEDCTFGVKLAFNGEVSLDQIYLAYDEHVNPETRKRASDFILENKEKLKMLLNQKREEVVPTPEDAFEMEEDMPF